MEAIVGAAVGVLVCVLAYQGRRVRVRRHAGGRAVLERLRTQATVDADALSARRLPARIVERVTTHPRR